MQLYTYLQPVIHELLSCWNGVKVEIPLDSVLVNFDVLEKVPAAVTLHVCDEFCQYQLERHITFSALRSVMFLWGSNTFIAGATICYW
jgi:hypothetical protein